MASGLSSIMSSGWAEPLEEEVDELELAEVVAVEVVALEVVVVPLALSDDWLLLFVLATFGSTVF